MKAQFDLDITAAKITALSSNNLDKYEYLTGGNVAHKPSTVEKAKFEYSQLGIRVFDKSWMRVIKKKSCLTDWKILKMLKKT